MTDIDVMRRYLGSKGWRGEALEQAVSRLHDAVERSERASSDFNLWLMREVAFCLDEHGDAFEARQ